MCYLPGEQLSSADGLSRMWGDVTSSVSNLEPAGPLCVSVTGSASLKEGGCQVPVVSSTKEMGGAAACEGGATGKKSVPVTKEVNPSSGGMMQDLTLAEQTN